MKIRRTIAAIGGALALFLSFALTPAQAQTGNHNCSEGSIDEPKGNIIIFDTTGGCALGSLNAGGQIQITSTGPVTISGAVTSVGNINISADGGALQTGSTITTTAGSIQLSGTTVTVNGVSNFGNGIGLYSGNGGNIHVVGALNGGPTSAVSILSEGGGAGTITVDSSVTAGRIAMQANGNILVTGAINSTSASGYVDVKTTAAGGTIKLDGTVTAPGQVVQLVAFGNISTKTIDTTSTSSGNGDVKIIANKIASGAISPFIIGGTGNSNGVNGSIITNTQSAGGQDAQTTKHNVGIVNGGPSATGGITVVNGSNISVAATASRAGCILLNARNGPFALQAGTLSANGAAGQSAGCINIAADTVTIGSNGTISANDNGTKGFNHYVSVAARQLSVTGTVNLQADGKGIDTVYPGSVLLLAKGSLSWTVPEDYILPITAPTRTDTATALTVSGSGSLVLRANGAINKVEVVAKPITFSNTGTLTIAANGASPNRVRISNPGATSGVPGLSFTGGNVTVRSDGVSGVGDASGGFVEIFGDQMTLNANVHTFSANGPTTGNGNGGRFYFGSTAATLKSTGRVTVTANAASAGSGNAILGQIGTGDPKAIQFFPGSVNIDVGTASALGQYSFAAKGGSTGGNGGTVYMGASALALKTANAINAAALAGNGDGGEIYLNNFISVDAAATVTAIGKGTGKGGKFTAFYFNPGFPLDVNSVVKVDAGSNALVTVQGGLISLNGVTCGQWKNGTGTGQTTWLKTYWDCVNPTGQDALATNPAIAANTLGAIKTTFDTNDVRLYVFPDVTAYMNFFATTLSAPDAAGTGYTQTFGPMQRIFAAVFKNFGSGQTLTATAAQEISGHELGHATSIINGAESAGTTYSIYAQNDFLQFDYTFVGSNHATSTPRAACSAGGTAPFDNISAESDGQPICNAGVLSSTYRVGGVATGTPFLNSKIAQKASSVFRWYGNTDKWRELYPQTFAYGGVAIGLGAANFYLYTADDLFNKNWFTCTLNWASDRLGGTAPGEPACAVPVPAWYTSQLTSQ